MNKKTVCNCENCQHRLCVSRVPIFSGLAQEELSKVAALIVKKKYEKGELIIMEGSCHESLIIIDQGQVKVFRYTVEGKEQILYIFAQGDFFGEKNLMKNQEASYNVEALETTNICMINKEDFQGLLRDYPEIGIKIIEELCSRMEKIEGTVQSMGTKSIESRINGVLLDFVERYGKKHHNGILVELPLSREGIANFIGTARETVSRKLSALQDEGVIEMIGNKKILVLDVDALYK
ncbi:MAG TPA: Crp/Fnr family transcriptional regulator [Pseudobacteroides sp.]|uniref:Crp/Fnr family transcriptional regulator n=1 Tax=Pseudobacteroides sp. TaxID=1968840 RepID=UPI002F923FD3